LRGFFYGNGYYSVVPSILYTFNSSISLYLYLEAIWFMDEGILSASPLEDMAIELSPWLSNICMPLLESTKFAKETAPSRFLTVCGIVIEKKTGSP
jgi:hypothetical protein